MAKRKKLSEEVEKIVEEELGVGEGQPGYVPEADNSGVEKNFFIRCPSCRWARKSSGLKVDLADLHEVTPGCRTCGKWRKFQCPTCGTPSTMQRIKRR